MKNLIAMALVVTGIANADFRLGWERPIMRANLTRVESSTAYPNAQTLTINKQDGNKRPTSFTLTEDTGLRCITTPCPSFATTEFKIVDISSSLRHSDSVRYEAIEVLENIPANVRLAPRRLTVLESSMEIVAPGGGGFQRRILWDVQVETFSGQTAIYSGRPQYLMTTMTDAN